MTHSPLHRRRRPVAATLSFALIAVFALPAAVMAQQETDPDKIIREADARLRGYEDDNVVLDAGGAAYPYFALLGLTAVAAGVMFKTSRRTHLD